MFMNSETAKALDSTYNRMQWAGEEYLLEEVIETAVDKLSKKPRCKFETSQTRSLSNTKRQNTSLCK